MAQFIEKNFSYIATTILGDDIELNVNITARFFPATIDDPSDYEIDSKTLTDEDGNEYEEKLFLEFDQEEIIRIFEEKIA